MSSGYGANFAEVIEKADIEKFCPKEYKAYLKALDNTDLEMDLQEFAREAGQGQDLLQFDKDFVKAYKNLCEAFKKKTGLHLNVNYHSRQDEGDRYDEVDEFYWEVFGMYELSKAGKKMKKYVTRKFFVTYG